MRPISRKLVAAVDALKDESPVIADPDAIVIFWVKGGETPECSHIARIWRGEKPADGQVPSYAVGCILRTLVEEFGEAAIGRFIMPRVSATAEAFGKSIVEAVFERVKR